ncbi:hypothetical protein NEUTE2DRAFT_126935 [Neurospora tetrasperma FGSC 2509]|nr:hypothetical protein NEUTE2DRAFT_126935 [Neurospora tetrasperma FGSC 2509]
MRRARDGYKLEELKKARIAQFQVSSSSPSPSSEAKSNVPRQRCVSASPSPQIPAQFFPNEAADRIVPPGETRSEKLPGTITTPTRRDDPSRQRSKMTAATPHLQGIPAIANHHADLKVPRNFHYQTECLRSVGKAPYDVRILPPS